MVGIRMPRKETNSRAFQAAGAAVGAVAGGGPGAMAGANVGGSVAGMVKGPGVSPVDTASHDSAMSRRMAASQDDHIQKLRESIFALPEMPEEIRKEYAKPLVTAYYKATGKLPSSGMEEA